MQHPAVPVANEIIWRSQRHVVTAATVAGDFVITIAEIAGSQVKVW
jgi:hypothetical protein